MFVRKLEENGRKACYLCSVSSRSFMYLVVFSFRWLSGERGGGERETANNYTFISLVSKQHITTT